MKERKARCNILGQDTCLKSACGICVTMNPRYAGRCVLTDNLKAILRPVSIMVPDFTLIAQIMVVSEGFSAAEVDQYVLPPTVQYMPTMHLLLSASAAMYSPCPSYHCISFVCFELVCFCSISKKCACVALYSVMRCVLPG